MRQVLMSGVGGGEGGAAQGNNAVLKKALLLEQATIEQKLTKMNQRKSANRDVLMMVLLRMIRTRVRKREESIRPASMILNPITPLQG